MDQSLTQLDRTDFFHDDQSFLTLPVNTTPFHILFINTPSFIITRLRFTRQPEAVNSS